jgi:hypothetical protein
MASDLPFHVSKSGKNLFDINMTLRGGYAAEWEQWVLLSSDRHWDNPKSDHALQKKHLDQAMERDAIIIDAGDLFCAMQGKYDKRSSKSDVRSEHNVGNYLDALIQTGAEFFAPYAKNFALVAAGNHETAIKKRHETDLTERFCSTVNYISGETIHNGGYSGFVRFKLTEIYDGKQKSLGRNVTLHYSHGYGGGGPVTKGVIQTNRKATYLPDADIVISGHVHESWQIELMRVRVGRSSIFHDTQTHICLPTYKEEFGTGFGGWHVERGAPPKPVGAVWLRFHYVNSRDPVKRGLKYDLIRAT